MVTFKRYFRNFLFTLLIPIYFGVLLFGEAHAALTTINFDDLSPGVPEINTSNSSLTFFPGIEVTNQYAAQGVTFSLVGSPFAGPYAIQFTDSGSNSVNAFGATGNVIVPSDQPGNFNYDIQLSFPNRIDYFSIMALDAEESFSVQGYLGNQLVTSAADVTSTFLGNWQVLPHQGAVYRVELGAVGGSLVFDRIIIDLTNDFGSGAGGPELYDNVVFNVAAVPIPAAFWLFGSGLVGLVGFAYRLKK